MTNQEYLALMGTKPVDQAAELVDQIAEAVVARLPGAVIPAVIPAELGAYIRAHTRHGIWRQTQAIGQSPAPFIAEWTLHPDGSMHLQLKDWGNASFWQGTFRPAEAAK